jgi:hypothetical protein
VTRPEEETSPSSGVVATPQPTATASPQPSATSSPAAGDFGPLVQFDKPSSTGLEKWLEERAKEKMGEHGSKMALFLKTLFSNLPYMMLCCIPLFAFVLKILYLRKHIFYIDHLIYALHIHSFAYAGVMLIGVITMGLNRGAPHALAGWILTLLSLWFALQVFLSIRCVYGQGWFFTFFKFFVGGFVYLIVLCVALAATFFVTLALPAS